MRTLLSLTHKNRVAAFIALLLVYVGANVALLVHDIYVLALLPVLLLVGYFVFYHPEKAILVAAMATPLSLKINFENYGLSLNLPTEPLVILLMGLFWFKLILDGGFDKRIFRHPVSIAIMVNMAWIGITTLTSTMPVVSLKFFISRLWFITVFYFMGAYTFRKLGNIKSFMWAFCISLLIAIGNAWIRHAAHGFSHDYSSKAVNPFFTDHGIYAAVISLFLPVMIYFFVAGKTLQVTLWNRFFALFMTIILSIAIVFSYTRAAWIGLAVSAAFMGVLWLRIRLRTLLLGAGLVLGVLAMYQTEIYFMLADNKSVSQTRHSDQHLQSITNITTDASNTERINRWKSAFRMWQQKPILGWGPGTYMFQYAPFQLSREMTIISTRGGDMGNAHSEYIGPLAESGILGTLTFIILALVVVERAMRLIYFHPDARVRYLATAILLGLISYFIHGFLNNYLDLDKAAIPFWAFFGIITALDLYYKPEEENRKNLGQNRMKN